LRDKLSFLEEWDMSSKNPVETVLAFLEAINSSNVDKLCALMSEDHVFVDGLGNRVEGKEAMRKGWTGYLKWFPDYRVSHDEIFANGEIVAAFGSAEGTYAKNGKLPKENHWRVPAAWKAVVRNGLLAEWHVYADNQPVRKIMSMPNP
jgi:ketosteroid isomerase-like protein